MYKSPRLAPGKGRLASGMRMGRRGELVVSARNKDLSGLNQRDSVPPSQSILQEPPRAPWQTNKTCLISR